MITRQFKIISRLILKATQVGRRTQMVALKSYAACAVLLATLTACATPSREDLRNTVLRAINRSDSSVAVIQKLNRMGFICDPATGLSATCTRQVHSGLLTCIDRVNVRAANQMPSDAAIDVPPIVCLGP